MNLGLILGLGARRVSGPWFSPLALFASGEQGAWLDPADFSTLFQDTAGTVPVTAIGQSVGLMLDKRLNGVGSNGAFRLNILNWTEDFDNAAWTKTATTVSANAFTAPDGTLTGDNIVEDTTNAIHRVHQPTSVGLGASFAQSIVARANGSRRLYINAIVIGGVGALFDLTGNGAVIAIAGTAVNRSASIQSLGGGLYRCTVIGTGTGTANNIWFQINRSLSSTAADDTYVGDGASGLGLWGAQLELGSVATAYQRITSSWPATIPGNHFIQATPASRPILQQDASGLFFLLFDGSDDFLRTPVGADINPGAVDKVQVFAGVRKLSDATVGVLLELSAIVNDNPGSFILAAPQNSTTQLYSFTSRGSASFDNVGARSFVTGVGNAPDTAVIAGLADIAAPSTIIRRNGTAFAAGTATQGTGNYGAYPLFIGRRGGTTLPYNGRLYQLIVRYGPNLSAGQIAAMENFVNQRTGAF